MRTSAIVATGESQDLVFLGLSPTIFQQTIVKGFLKWCNFAKDVFKVMSEKFSSLQQLNMMITKSREVEMKTEFYTDQQILEVVVR